MHVSNLVSWWLEYPILPSLYILASKAVESRKWPSNRGPLVRFPNPLAPGQPDTCQLGNPTRGLGRRCINEPTWPQNPFPWSLNSRPEKHFPPVKFIHHKVQNSNFSSSGFSVLLGVSLIIGGILVVLLFRWNMSSMSMIFEITKPFAFNHIILSSSSSSCTSGVLWTGWSRRRSRWEQAPQSPRLGSTHQSDLFSRWLLTSHHKIWLYQQCYR